MTTSIAVRGYDPNRKIPYILVATDSKTTDDIDKSYTYNGQKITFNKHANLITAHAEDSIHHPENIFNKKEAKMIKNLQYKKYKNTNELFKDGETLNKDCNVSLLFASNDKKT
jgi:hypothetical protein